MACKVSCRLLYSVYSTTTLLYLNGCVRRCIVDVLQLLTSHIHVAELFHVVVWPEGGGHRLGLAAELHPRREVAQVRGVRAEERAGTTAGNAREYVAERRVARLADRPTALDVLRHEEVQRVARRAEIQIRRQQRAAAGYLPVRRRGRRFQFRVVAGGGHGDQTRLGRAGRKSRRFDDEDGGLFPDGGRGGTGCGRRDRGVGLVERGRSFATETDAGEEPRQSVSPARRATTTAVNATSALQLAHPAGSTTRVDVHVSESPQTLSCLDNRQASR